MPVRSAQVPDTTATAPLSEDVRGEAALPASTIRNLPSISGTGVLAGVAPVAGTGRRATGLRPAGVRRPSGWLSSQLAATVADPPRPAEGRA